MALRLPFVPSSKNVKLAVCGLYPTPRATANLIADRHIFAASCRLEPMYNLVYVPSTTLPALKVASISSIKTVVAFVQSNLGGGLVLVSY